MKRCLIGGTFDPPHWGHALLAETLRTELHIDVLVFVPAYIPPHKQEDSLSSPEHRVAMLTRFCNANPHFTLDQREIGRQGVSYTIDTIREVKREQALKREEIGFLMGADNYLALETWREAEHLVQECVILVAERPTYPMKESLPFEEQVRFLDLPRIEISSSQIRARTREGKSVRYYVTPEVAEYITHHELYRL